MDALALLGELGLTPGEARLYLSMLEAPLSRVPSLARAAGMSRPRAYDVAASLMERGLAVERRGLYKRFEAVPLDEALAILLRRQRERLRALEARADELLRARRVGGASAPQAPGGTRRLRPSP